jgi:hypothetical protein
LLGVLGSDELPGDESRGRLVRSGLAQPPDGDGRVVQVAEDFLQGASWAAWCAAGAPITGRPVAMA